jgi:hypothetical protein
MNILFPLIIIPKVGFVTIASALVSELPIPEIKNTFAVIYSVFTESSQAPVEYKLYNFWTLDNTLDIYVYNNLGRSNVTNAHVTRGP